MRTFIKFLIVPLLMMQVFDVTFFKPNCEIVSHYYAEKVYINTNKNLVTVILPNGDSEYVYLNDDVKAVQISDEGFFRSYVYDNGVVAESKEPYCRGAM